MEVKIIDSIEVTIKSPELKPLRRKIAIINTYSQC
jgi:hypothetical protein